MLYSVLQRLIHILKIPQSIVSDHPHDRPAEQAGKLLSVDQFGLALAQVFEDEVMPPFEQAQQSLPQPFEGLVFFYFCHYGLKYPAQGNRRDAHIGGQYVLRDAVLQGRMQIPVGV